MYSLWGQFMQYLANYYSELVRVAQQRDSTRQSRVEKASSMLQRS